MLRSVQCCVCAAMLTEQLETRQDNLLKISMKKQKVNLLIPVIKCKEHKKEPDKGIKRLKILGDPTVH